MFGFGQKPLAQRVFEAARVGNLPALQQLTASFPIRAPALAPTVRDLEYIDRDGRTALSVAAQKGYVGVASLLISKGANINACSNKRDGGTPLHEATSSASSPEMVNLLIASGASPFVANTRGATSYDIAIDHKVVTLLRRYEGSAKLGAFINIKVPGLLGFGGEFREFWAVLFQRIPNPAVPPQSRVSHSQLFLFATYSDASPVARIWTDGAQVALLQHTLRNGATAVLMLHDTHQKPMHVYVGYDTSSRPCIFMKPSLKPSHAASVSTLASVINDTTSAAARAHQRPSATNSNAAATPHTPQATAQPQYNPTPTSSHAVHAESAAEGAWAFAAAAATSVSAIAGSVLSNHGGSASSSTSGQHRPGGTAPSAPLAPPGYVPAQYHSPTAPGANVGGAPAAPPQPPSGAQPAMAQATASNAASNSATSQVPSTTDEVATEGEEPCIVCLENKKTMGFLHQGTMHLCACKSCAEKWFQQHKTCPMCNVHADALVPVFS